MEGTWEEILAHSKELTGHRVRLTILQPTEDESYPGIPANQRPSTAESLLRFAGTWVGDDFEECLQATYNSKLPAEF